jgi:predicted PurR-regulated permease PerM
LVLVLLAVFGVVLYALVRPFFASLVWALLLAFLLSPVNLALRRKFRGRRGWAAASVTLVVLFGLAIPTAFLAAKFVAQAVGLVQQVTHAYANGARPDVPLLGKLAGIIERYWPGQAARAYDYLASRVSGLLSGAVNGLLGLAAGIINGVTGLALTLLILFFLLRDGDGWGKRLLSFVPLPEQERERLIEQTAAVTRATVLGSLLTALVQGVLVGIGFAIVGLPTPVVFGVVAGFLSLLPVVGTGFVWIPGAVVLAAQGRWGAGIFLALWGLLLVGLVDNLLRPWFVSGKSEVPTIAVLLGVLGGLSAFGFVGTFLGPVIFSVALALIKLAPHAGASRETGPSN